MSDFRKKVLDYINCVPRGRVVSYGQVAAACGSPRAARQVGAILRVLDYAKDKTPWWRVVNNQGILSIKGNWTATKDQQAALLRKEGIEVKEDFSLNINQYRWSGVVSPAFM